jgi:hypothetical protein
VASGPHFIIVSMNDTLHKHVKSNFTFFLLLLLQTHLQHTATYCSTLRPLKQFQLSYRVFAFNTYT